MNSIKLTALQKIPLALLGFIVSGCSDEMVVVPGDDFFQEVVLIVDKTEVQVGEPVFLKVTRSTGGWVEIMMNPIVKMGCYYVSEPPKYEDDTSWTISFKVEPKSNVEFLVPTEVDLAELRPRSVIFKEPGKYYIQGHSSVWCPPGMDTNEIEVTVKNGT